jgi:hypothetical protein
MNAILFFWFLSRAFHAGLFETACHPPGVLFTRFFAFDEGSLMSICFKRIIVACYLANVFLLLLETCVVVPPGWLHATTTSERGTFTYTSGGWTPIGLVLRSLFASPHGLGVCWDANVKCRLDLFCCGLVLVCMSSNGRTFTHGLSLLRLA